MAKKVTEGKEKGKPGRPKVKGNKPLVIRLKPGLKEAVDAHVKTMKPATSTTAVVEWLLQEYLEKEGKWPPPEQQEPQQG